MSAMDGAHDALTRMKRAHDRGTGCHLTAEMVAGLGLTFLAETWGEEDPRDAAPIGLPTRGIGREWSGFVARELLCASLSNELGAAVFADPFVDRSQHVS